MGKWRTEADGGFDTRRYVLQDAQGRTAAVVTTIGLIVDRLDWSPNGTPMRYSPADGYQIGGAPGSDGLVTVDDYTTFVNDFAASTILPSTDLDATGTLNVTDYNAFNAVFDMEDGLVGLGYLAASVTGNAVVGGGTYQLLTVSAGVDVGKGVSSKRVVSNGYVIETELGRPTAAVVVGFDARGCNTIDQYSNFSNFTGFGGGGGMPGYPCAPAKATCLTITLQFGVSGQPLSPDTTHARTPFPAQFFQCPMSPAVQSALEEAREACAARRCRPLKVICGYCNGWPGPITPGNTPPEFKPLLPPGQDGRTYCNFWSRCPTEVKICLDRKEGWETIMIHELVHVRQCCEGSWSSMDCDVAIKAEYEAYVRARQCDRSIVDIEHTRHCCQRACNSAQSVCPSFSECLRRCQRQFN